MTKKSFEIHFQNITPNNPADLRLVLLERLEKEGIKQICDLFCYGSLKGGEHLLLLNEKPSLNDPLAVFGWIFLGPVGDNLKKHLGFKVLDEVFISKDR